MQILIENLQKKIPLNLLQIKKITKQILRYEGVKDSELSIVFVTSQRIRALNQKFLHRNHATDVLAFDMRDPGEAKDASLVGDIIISTDAAIQNAKTFKTSIEHELVLYVIHGILHILGYDDHTPKDVKKMRQREAGIIKKIGTGSIFQIIRCDRGDVV